MSDTKIRKRSEVPDKYKWNLSAIYSDDALWEKDFIKVRNMAQSLSKYRGTLEASSENLFNCLEDETQMSRLYEKVMVYAHMRSHQDTTNSHYQSLSDRADSLGIEISSAGSYITPEILSIPDEKINSFIKENDKLKVYERQLNDIRRFKPHVLSASEEALLAAAGDLAQAPSTIYNMINNADIKFPVIKDEDGKDIEITKGRFISLMENHDRRVRKDTFDAFYTTYESQKNTMAATLSSNVKANLFDSRTRKYSSARESFLFQDNVSLEVYDNLIKTIHENMDLMHRYVALRKRMLGLDELHMYDVFAPLTKEATKKIPYEEAVDTVTKGLSVLGDTYIKDLKNGFTEGWIDVYENEGKRSGAYSWGCYDSHPYVLLNYENNLDNMFTLAHEMGHSMHSYYSNKNQPYVDAHYKIFVAEVASTCNESLLMDYLLKNTTDKQERLYLLNHYMDSFRGTVYRQTMFAEFEKLIHERAEQGEALTAETLSSIYYELNKQYYGPDMVADDHIAIEWARIPHFYSSFYVYKYATGFSAATALSKDILDEGAPALEKYLNFLKSGGNDYPLELLKKAGVDMTTPKPINDALKVFKGLLDEFDSLINE